MINLTQPKYYTSKVILYETAIRNNSLYTFYKIPVCLGLTLIG